MSDKINLFDLNDPDDNRDTVEEDRVEPIFLKTDLILMMIIPIMSKKTKKFDLIKKRSLKTQFG